MTRGDGMRNAKVAGMLLVAASLFSAQPVSAGSITYGYDALGRLVRVAYPNGAIIQYTYDANGNRTAYVVTGSPNSAPTGTQPVGN